MSVLASNKFISCDVLCSGLMQNPEMLFSGFVNSRGRMVAQESNPALDFHSEKNIEMFVMEIALDFSMKREFNDMLGEVEYAVTKRKNANIVCIPMDQLILIIITDDHASVEEVVKGIYHTLAKFTETNFA